MGTGYYPQFDLIRIDAAGGRISLPSTTINVYNVTTAASLGTLVSDTNGVIVQGSFTGGSVNVGDLVRFSHATYPDFAYVTLQTTQEDAYFAVENDLTCYVVENLFEQTTNTRLIDIYAQDLDNPDTPIIRLGGGKAGETAKLSYVTGVAKNLRLFPVSLDENLNASRTDFNTTNYEDVVIPARSHILFDHFSDQATQTTSEETLWIDQLDAGLLATNGDKVRIEYGGTLTSSSNAFYIYLGSNLIFDSTTFTPGLPSASVDWHIDVLLMRVSNTQVRSFVKLTVFDPDDKAGLPWTDFVDTTGLNLTTTDYDVKLNAASGGGAGNIVAKLGYGEFVPAASTNTGYLTDLGEILTDDGDELSTTT